MRTGRCVAMPFLMLLLVLLFAVPALAHSPEEAYGYNSLASGSNRESEERFYQEMYVQAEHFLGEERNVTAEENYVVASLDYAAFGVDAYRAIEIWKLFFVDHPEYYWLANRVTVSEGRLHLYVYDIYAVASERKNTDRTLQAGKNLILSAANGLKGELSRAVAIHDRLLEVSSYAYAENGTPSDAPFAHNIVGVLTGQGGVCDGYAKTYALLLREIGIDCIFVDGTANGVSHAWNMVRIGDAWYWVDPTWNDQQTGNKDKYFGMENLLFLQDHTPYTPEGTGAGYLYPLPAAASEAIALTKLFHNASQVGAYESPAAALAAIPSGDTGEWSLQLMGFDGAGRIYRFPAGKTPAVRSLTVSSIGGEEPLELCLEGPLLAGSHLRFENILLVPVMGQKRLSVDMLGHTLTFAGDWGGSAAKYDEEGLRAGVLALESPDGVLNIDTTDVFSWDGDIAVHTMNAQRGRISVGAGQTRITNLRILSRNASVSFSDEPTQPVTVEIGNVYLGAASSFSLSNSRRGNRFAIDSLTGEYRLAMAVQFDDANYYPDLRLKNVEGIAVDLSLRTYSEEEYADPFTGEIAWSRREANLAKFDGRIAFVPNIDLALGSLHFILPDRTVNMSTEAFLTRDGWLTVPVTEKLTGTPDQKEDPVSHEYTEFIVLRAASCRKSGEAYRVCRLCGLTEYKMLPMVAHKFGEFHILQAPTVNTAGIKQQVCSVCGHNQTEEIPVLSPTPVPTQKPDVKPQNPSPTPGAVLTPVPTKKPTNPGSPEEPRRTTSPLPWIIAGAGIVAACAILLPELLQLKRKNKTKQK